MKDFDIKKFLTENQITAASQQVSEEESKSSPLFQDKTGKGNIPDPYHIFVVKFKDGDLLIGMDDKGMGGITAGEWWQKSMRSAVNELQKLKKGKDQNIKDTAKSKGSTKDLNKLSAEEIESLSPLARKINDISYNVVGKQDGEETDKVVMPVAIPQLVDRAETRDIALEKYQKWIDNARKSIGEKRVLNKDTDEAIDKSINLAAKKKQRALDAREKKQQFGESSEELNEGQRRWTKLKQLFGLK